jgi:hypothetical protein
MKITSITEKTFQGKVTGHSIVLDDGTIGNLSDKESDTGLKAGDEVTAVVKDYVSKAGKHSNLITLKRAVFGAPVAPPQGIPPLPPKPQIHVGTGKSAEDWKVETSIRLWEKLMDGFYDEKLDDAKVLLKWNEWKKFFDADINDIFGKR